MGINGEDDDGGVNSAKPDLKNFGVDELRRIGRSASMTSVHERGLQFRRQKAESDLETADFLDSNPPPISKGMAGDHWLKHTEKMRAKALPVIESVDNKLHFLGEARRERLNQRAINTISGAYSESSINGMVAASMNTAETHQRGTGLSNYSWEQLSQQRANVFGEIGKRRQDNVALAGSFIGPNGPESGIEKKFAEDAQAMHGHIAQLGPINAAMKQLRIRGLDPESKQRNLIKMGDEAQGIVGFNQLQSDMQSGKNPYGRMSGEDLQKKEVEAAQKLVTALDELRASAGKTKEELGKLNQNAEDAAKELKEVQEASAAGGGNRSSGAQMVQAYASNFANLAMTGANAIQTMGINQPMQQMGNIAGYASLENQKYDMFRGAVGGDMTARMNLTGWSTARGFGGRMAENAGWVLGAKGAAGALTTVAGGAATAEAVGQAGNPLSWATGKADHVNSVFGAVGQTAEGASMTASSLTDYLRHISTSQAEIGGNNATMAATKQLTHVSGYQAQQFRDYSMGLMGAAQNMGSGANAFLNETAGAEYMGKMRGVGLSMGEMTSLSQFGSQNMGSMFSVNQPLQAKRFENHGFGSAEENMKRMASLSAGSGQNPSQSLEKIIEMGTANGLNSSRALTMIAENTGQLVAETTGKGGVDVTGEVSRILIGSTDRNNPNQEFATRKAMTTYQAEEQTRNNRSASFSGQIAVGRLQKDLGMSWDNAFGTQAMSVAELNKISHMSPEDATQAFRLQGVDVSHNALFKNDPARFFKTLTKDKMMTEVEGLGAGFAFGANNKFGKVWDWMAADKSGDRARSWASGSAEGLTKDAASQQAAFIKAIKANNPNMDATQAMRGMIVAGGLVEPGSVSLGDSLPGTFGSGQSERNRGGQVQIDAANAGASGSSGDERLREQNNSGQAAENAGPGELAWAAAAAKSASDFGASAIRLDSASSALEKAASKLLEMAGIKSLVKTDPKDKFPQESEPKQHATKNVLSANDITGGYGRYGSQHN